MEDLEMCSTGRNDRAWSIETLHWVAAVNEKVRNMETITQLSLDLTGNRRYHKPYIVSFGPHYNGHESFIDAEKMKENVLLWSLKTRNKRLDDYVDALWVKVPDLKRECSQLGLRCLQDNDDAFLRMMILDGFFLVEMLRQANEWFQDDPDYFLSNREEANHPAWSIGGIGINELREHYRHDMLLLKNQLPLETLYKIEAVNHGPNFREGTRNINKWIIRFVWSFPWASRTLGGKFHNVLDLYRSSLLHQGYTCKDTWKRVKSKISCFLSKNPSVTKFEFDTPLAKELLFNIRSATELSQEGFSFTTSEATTLMDVSFGGRTIRLPQIYADYYTRSILFNIIAYENVNCNAKEITSYAYILCRLLDHVDDVKFLQQRGIILSTLHCGEILEMFDSLRTEDVMGDPNVFLVQKYKLMCRKLRECLLSGEWQRDLWQNYLKSPWSIVSLIAAFLLFSLTAIQTVYTILGYYNSK